MIPQAHITAWRAKAPWPEDYQVEHDLVLSRVVVELFNDYHLADNIALRGGTSLNKLFITTPRRYSEDIDLVQIKPGPIGPAIDAIRGRLAEWLGNPKRSQTQKSTRLLYQFESEIPPIRSLRLKIEINTQEHFTILGRHTRQLVVDNPWFTGEAEVVTYELDELMGTKLRAMYQRRKGRDLFDLWLCLHESLIDPERVASCCVEYMAREGHPATRARFEQNMADKRNDPAFLGDIKSLLAAGIVYDPIEAFSLIQDSLICRLPGKPWRGKG